MNKNLTAKAVTLIAATKNKVWEALITPSAIKEYMFGSDVETDWKKGGKISWKGEFKGKKYTDSCLCYQADSDTYAQFLKAPENALTNEPDIDEIFV